MMLYAVSGLCKVSVALTLRLGNAQSVLLHSAHCLWIFFKRRTQEAQVLFRGGTTLSYSLKARPFSAKSFLIVSTDFLPIPRI